MRPVGVLGDIFLAILHKFLKFCFISLVFTVMPYDVNWPAYFDHLLTFSDKYFLKYNSVDSGLPFLQDKSSY